MTHFNFLSLTLLLACVTTGLNAYPFAYETMGPMDSGICSTGRQQSPIDVKTQDVQQDSNLRLTLDFYGLNSMSHISYEDNFGFIPNLMPSNGTHNTYQVLGPFGTLFADDAKYNYLASDYKQMHMHSPSVNTVNGQIYDAEVHFMFLTDLAETAGLNLQRRVAQFAIFFKVDDSAPENPLIAALNLDKIGSTFYVNFTQLVTGQIGTNPEFYYYEGSLDAAGCDELINYYIVKNPLTITSKQLVAIVDMLKGEGTGSPAQGKNRETQPLNGRVVKLGNENC